MHQRPHYLLITKTESHEDHGVWQFLLRSQDDDARLEASGVEADFGGERLELLCVVRGLEALEQPSRVTLLTRSPYVREGIRRGIHEWHANGWRWERFGRMVPVNHQDLWRRIHRAMQFHTVDCRTWRLDGPHGCSSRRGANRRAHNSIQRQSPPRQLAAAG